MCKRKTSAISGSEPLPQVHWIHNTDLTEFVYKLHMFAGDFLRERAFNLHSLLTNTSMDSIAIMGKRHMWLDDAAFAYCTAADLHQMAFTTEYLGARAFLFHTDRTEEGRLYGNVLMMDLDTLRQDIKAHALSPCTVDLEYPDGRNKKVSLETWYHMELYEKDALKSWGFRYDLEELSGMRSHYAKIISEWKNIAFSVNSEDLEERLNTEYMLEAQHSDPDLFRIPMGTAKQLLLCDEVPVYRLLPEGAEKLSPVSAVKTGLWYQSYREFAVKPEDLKKLDQFCQKEIDKLIGADPQRQVPKKPVPSQSR